MKDTARNGWRRFGYLCMSVVPLIAYAVLMFLVSMVLSVVMLLPAAMAVVQEGVQDMYGYLMEYYMERIAEISMLAGVVYAVLALIGMGLWYYFGCRRKSFTPPKAARNPLNLVILAVLAYCMQYAAQIIMILVNIFLPRAMDNYEQMIELAGVGEVTVLGVLYGVILGPIAEELVFRGLTLYYAQKFTRRFWLANLIQAVLFGVMHMNLVQGIYASVLGLVLGLVYHRFRSLYASMWLHIFFNFLAFGPLVFLDGLLPQNAVFQLCWYGLMCVAAVLLLWVIYRRTAQKPAAAEKQAGM